MDAGKVAETGSNGAGTGDSELGVPSFLHVGRALGPARHLVTWGPATGWMTPQGIALWEREVSVVAKDAVSPALKEELGATFPEEQIAAAKMPLAARAAKASPLVGVTRGLVDKLVAKGVRVHTVGFDRISGGFYYFAEGGAEEPVRVQGSLFDMIAPSLGDGSNADVERLMDGLIDRLLVQLSDGKLTEIGVELAAALPKLTTDNTGLADCDLEAFEKDATALERNSEKHATHARALADKLSAAAGEGKLSVPLYGEALREVQPAMEVDAGAKKIALPAHGRWVVSGVIVPEPKPVPEPVKAEPVKVVEKAKPAAAKTEKKDERAARAEATPKAEKKSETAKKADASKKARKETKTDPAIGRKLAAAKGQGGKLAKVEPPRADSGGMGRILLIAVTLAVMALLIYKTTR